MMSLTLNKEKTHLIDLRRPEENERKSIGNFTFLGFRFDGVLAGRDISWSSSKQKRMQRAYRALNTWCKQNRHSPSKEQVLKLNTTTLTVLPLTLTAYRVSIMRYAGHDSNGWEGEEVKHQ